MPSQTWVSCKLASQCSPQRGYRGHKASALHPTHPKINKNKLFNLLWWFVVSGGVESTRESHTSRMGLVSNDLVTGDARKPITIISWFWALLTRPRFFFFVPRTPDPIFRKNPKDTRQKMIDIHIFKNVCGAVWCHFVLNPDVVFWHTKQEF